MSPPLISVCIPTYNGEKYLAECLDSVIRQEWSDMEIIVTDDKSDDNSCEIVREYMKIDNRIKLFVNEKNLGLTGNWNQCMQHSSGEWIKYVFQDDYLNRNCLSGMMAHAGSKIQLITCDRQFVFENNVDTKLKNEYIFGMTSPQKIFSIHEPGFINANQVSRAVARLLTANFIGEPTVALFRRSLTNTIGYFNSSMIQLCDLEYWLRIATNYGMFYIPEALAFFRVHPAAATSVNRADNLDLADNAIMYNEFLYGKQYINFRKQFSYPGFYRFREVIKLRMYEMNCRIIKDKNPKLKERMELLGETNFLIKKMKRNFLTTRFILPFVLARRLFSNLIKKDKP